MFRVKQERTYLQNHTHSEIELYEQGALLYSCYSLEDVGRPEGIKIPAWTCVPEGLFRAKVSMSNRFKRPMIMLYNQDNGYEIIDDLGNSWKGIRVHAGVHVDHSHGCILANSNHHNGQYWGKCDQDLIDIVGEDEFLWEIRRK